MTFTDIELDLNQHQDPSLVQSDVRLPAWYHRS